MQLRQLKLKGAPAVPLTSEDKEILKTIYTTRLQVFLSVVLGLLFIINIYVRPLPPDPRFHPVWEWAVAKIWLHIIIAIPLAVMFRRRVWAYRRDIARGEKLVLYERVGYKQHFPITGQYFLGLEDADHMHHEVDADTYCQVQEGDLFPVYFAPYSKFAFDMSRAFPLM